MAIRELERLGSLCEVIRKSDLSLKLCPKGSHRPDLYSRRILGLQGKVLAGQVIEFYTVYY